jgi:hypothetical protein
MNRKVGATKCVSAFAGIALVAAATAMSARLPTRLAKDETTRELAVTAGSTSVTLDLKGNPLPQPYTAFGFRAYTTYPRQAVRLKWSLQCFRGKKSVARSGVVRGHHFVIVWQAPTMPRADYCFVDAMAKRPYGSGDRLIASLLGRR